MAAIILAGGSSSRLGENKALLPFGEKTLIEIMINKISVFFDKIQVICKNADDYSFLQGIQLTEDIFPEKNAVMPAIYSGLVKSKDKYNFVFACDMPYLNLKVIDYLWQIKGNYDAVIPFVDFKKSVLHSVYSQDIIPILEKNIEANVTKMSRALRQLNVKYVPEDALKIEEPELLSFFHVKTFVDYLLVKNDF